MSSAHGSQLGSKLALEEQVIELKRQADFHKTTISELQLSNKELHLNHETVVHALKRDCARWEEKWTAADAELTKGMQHLT